MKRVLSSLFAGLVIAGCGPNPPPPVKVMVVAPKQTGAYSTREVQLQTITSITALKGTVASLIGGGRIIIDSTDPLQNLKGGLANQTDDERLASIVKDRGLDVRGNYIERAGVLWPADFDTWNMATTYYNFEQSYAYFQTVMGVDLPEIQNQKVYYWPEVHFDDPVALTDNALYLSVIKSFVVVPQAAQQRIPLAMNLGIIAHETAHRVFNHRVLIDEGIHPALERWSLAPFNLLKSIDEGFADFHGYGATALSDSGPRPNFLEVSLSDPTALKVREVSNNKACMTAPLRTSFTNSAPGAWVSSPDMYQVGNLFAAALYQAGNRVGGPTGVKQMAKFLVNSYDDSNPESLGLRQLVNPNLTNPAAFTPEAVANTIAAHITNDELKDAWCSEIVDRMQLDCPNFPCGEKLPACRSNSVRGTACTVLP